VSNAKSSNCKFNTDNICQQGRKTMTQKRLIMNFGAVLSLRKRAWQAASALALAGFAPVSALAAGSGMPWEAPLNQILASIEGPVARIVAVLVITITGLTLAFGDTSGGFRRLVQVVFGLSIAFGATSFFLSFFSFGGGALV
jgi:type IV secretion system protein TrbC